MGRSSFDGVNSVRILAKDVIVVDLTNDRGNLLISLGRSALQGARLYGLRFWALCLGFQAVSDDRDWLTLSDAEKTTWLDLQVDLLRKVVERVDRFSEPEWATTEACVRVKDEEYWRARGLWPLPETGAVMRKGSDDR